MKSSVSCRAGPHGSMERNASASCIADDRYALLSSHEELPLANVETVEQCRASSRSTPTSHDGISGTGRWALDLQKASSGDQGVTFNPSKRQNNDFPAEAKDIGYCPPKPLSFSGKGPYQV